VGSAPVRSTPAIDPAAVAARAARYRAAREAPLVAELVKRFAAEPLAQEQVEREAWLARFAAEQQPATERSDGRN
jgi:hypothetical protein